MDAQHRRRGSARVLTTIAAGAIALTFLPTAQAADIAGRTETVTPDALPACSPAVLADTQKAINDYTDHRKDLQEAKIGAWGTATKPPARYTAVAEDPFTMDAIRKAATLPCDPQVSLANLAAAPANVQTAASILTLDRWNSMIHPAIVGTGGGNGPAPTGFETGQESLGTFLNIVGRYPYLCGEKGTFATVEEACQRELATIFAHAAQETGGASPRWESILTYTREQNCYPDKCTTYNTGAVADFGAPADVSFYGRGMKQLSYPYNYFGFSSDWYGDPDRLIQRPDEVAQTAEAILGSGIWFYMAPQPPKPSLHSVMVGTYRPNSDPSAVGLSLDGDGAILDRFNASNSLINGAVECRPEDDPTKTPDKVREAQQISINRFTGYDALLTLFGVQRTPPEAAIVPGTSRCMVANGNAFANPSLLYQPKIYVNAKEAPDAELWPKVCPVMGYQSVQPLSLITPGIYDYCVDRRAPRAEAREIPAPQGLRELWTTHDAIALAWDAPEGPLATTIIGYDVAGGLGSSWFTEEPTIIIDNLSAGAQYTIAVRARTRTSESPPATISVWTLLDPMPQPDAAREPSEPRDLVPSDVTQTSVRLTWRAPADDGGSAVTGYRVAWGLGRDATTADRSFTVTGLKPGVEYTFWVRAENAAGLSPAARVSVWTQMEPEPWPGGLLMERGDGSDS